MQKGKWERKEKDENGSFNSKITILLLIKLIIINNKNLFIYLLYISCAIKKYLILHGSVNLVNRQPH